MIRYDRLVLPLTFILLTFGLGLSAQLGFRSERPTQAIEAAAIFEFGPTWSAQDEIVFFAGTAPTVTDPQLNLIRVNASGENRRALTDAPGRDWQPWFSPDGKRIYFSSERSGNPEIYVMNEDGTGVEPVTSNGANNFTPYPSPDGRLLAFASDMNGNMDLYLLDLESGQPTQLTFDPSRDWLPAWNPNGIAIAFISNRTGNDDVFLADFRDGLPDVDIVQLTTDEGIDTRVNWYDGKLIVWESNRRGNLDLFSARIQGDQLDTIRAITHSQANDFGRPAFSPRKDKMAFGSTRNGSAQVFITDVVFPVSVGLDADDDNALGDEEIMRAIEFWARGQELLNLGRSISDDMILRLIDIWTKGLEIDTVL